MKNTLQFILLFGVTALVTVSPVASQTIADPPSVFGRFDGQTYIFSPTYSIFNGSNIGTMTIHLDTTNLVAFNQTKFYLGHQWGTASRNVNKRLHNNFNNENLYYSDFRQIIFGAADTSQPYFVSWKMGDFFGYYGAMQFDPDAALEGANGTFVPRTGDNTGAAFGFRYKDTVAGRLTTNPSDANFRRYALLKDSVSTPLLVLKNVDKGNALVSYETQESVGSAAWQKEMNDNGQRWYVAVNLRRTNIADTTADTAVVLTIKLPYVQFPYNDTLSIGGDTIITLQRRSSTIRFDSVSSVRSNGMYDTIRTERGLMDAKLLDSAQTPGFNRSTLIIRRNMLPRRANPDSNDITISAFFRAIHKDSINPRLQGYANKSSDRIDSLDIEVTYHGNADVAIDWIRLETPRARQLLRGELDREFAARLSVLMDTLRYWRDTKGFSKLRLAAIYLNDEPGGRPAEWRAFRYQAKFLDRLATTEGAFDNRYGHVVPQRNYWGSVPASGGNSLCSPDDGSGYEKYTYYHQRPKFVR